MRLLSIHNHNLRDFIGDKIPKFAILSHTWGDDEVTFEDMRNGTGPKKPFFSKIRNTCRQAAKDGFEWVWIDTCCIDKSSSAELSEAINSMYSWYEQAARCYAYLSDVFSGSDFESSRWFTRGWTLQELIAPSVVDFFDSEWKFMGERVDLADRICTTTGIPSKLLCRQSQSERDEFNCPMEVALGDYSVAQRMSWASCRSCTRIEDIAYCLLGLFDVNMPLLYGEGRKSFMRLQEAILQETGDHSLLAWTVPGDGSDERLWSPCSVLAKSPADFVHSGDVVPRDGLFDPPSLTRLGLYINMPVYRHNAYTHKSHLHGMAHDVFLDCHNASIPSLGDVVIRVIPARDDKYSYDEDDNKVPKSFYRLGTPSIQYDNAVIGRHDQQGITIRKTVAKKELLSYKRTQTSMCLQGIPAWGGLGRNSYDVHGGPYEYKLVHIRYPDHWDECSHDSDGDPCAPADLPTRNRIFPHLAVFQTGRWCQWDLPWSCFGFTNVPCSLDSGYICVKIGQASRYPFYVCFACDNWHTFYFGLRAEEPPPEVRRADELGFSSCPFPPDRGTGALPVKGPLIREHIFVDDLRITATVELEDPETPEGEATGRLNYLLVLFEFERIRAQRTVSQPYVRRLPGKVPRS